MGWWDGVGRWEGVGLVGGGWVGGRKGGGLVGGAKASMASFTVAATPFLSAQSAPVKHQSLKGEFPPML